MLLLSQALLLALYTIHYKGGTMESITMRVLGSLGLIFGGIYLGLMFSILHLKGDAMITLILSIIGMLFIAIGLHLILDYSN